MAFDFSFGTTLSKVQALFLVMYSGITPADAQFTFVGAWKYNWSCPLSAKQALTPCPITLVLGSLGLQLYPYYFFFLARLSVFISKLLVINFGQFSGVKFCLGYQHLQSIF